MQKRESRRERELKQGDQEQSKADEPGREVDADEPGREVDVKAWA